MPMILESTTRFFTKTRTSERIERQGALTLRQETLDEFPAMADIMAPISAGVTDEVITEINGKVDLTTHETTQLVL